MILHLSDPHFGAERPGVAAALVELARARRPRLVVLSGDLTQRARPAEFQAARDFLDALCAASGLDARRHALVVPGNHDVPLLNLPRRLFNPYGAYARCFGAPHDAVLADPQAWIAGVNTTRPWRHRHGEVSAAQVSRVAERLRAAPNGRLRLVVTHQPLMVVEPADRRHLLRGHAGAAQAWAAAGADLLLAGHIHQSFVAPLAAEPGGTWVVQTGTAVSRRTREQVPNSVHLIRLSDLPGDTRAVVERWDCQEAEARAGRGCFRQMTETPIPVRRTSAGPASA